MLTPLCAHTSPYD